MKKKLDAKSKETKYEVLIEVEKGQRTRKQIAEQYRLASSNHCDLDEDQELLFQKGLNLKRKRLHPAGCPEVRKHY